MARSNIIELFTRVFNIQDRKDKIYTNGIDNLYPERIERIIDASVTAKLASEKMFSFLLGKGFEDTIDETILNPKKELTAYHLLRRACKDVSRQKGFWMHINYDLEGIPNYCDILKFKNCRVSEEDYNGYSGFAWYSKQWDTETSILSVLSWFKKKDKKNFYYPYNPDPKVINEQRKADAPKDADVETMLRSYRGQVLFVNLDDDSVYPNAWIDPAYNDADTEARISLFRNDRIRTGFLGANIIITPPSDNEQEGGITDDELRSLLGAENSSNILRVEVETSGDKKLSDYIHIETIKSEVDTDQFKYDEEKVQENILNCYRNVPKILVKSSDGALFGPNAEALRTAQRIYQEETADIRKTIEDTFNKVFEKHPTLADKFHIIPLIDEAKEETIEPETIQEDAVTDQ